MKQKSSQPRPHSWYKRKNYLHFDFALKKPAAVSYVLDTKNIVKHNFVPLIHYTQIARKYKKNKETGKLEFKKKPRNIFYASHIDGYIYAYYNYMLGEKYEAYLKKHGLTENVSAYRLIKKDGEGYSNIQFAREAFDFIKQTDGCNVLCIDISSFFDKLCPQILKNNWHRVWANDGSGALQDDHYRVFRSLTNFHYTEEKDIVHLFSKEPRKRNKIDDNDRQAKKNELNRSFYKKICSFQDLRAKAASIESLMRKKSNLGISGIPQGTAISGMLANIFMIDFDSTIRAKIEGLGGLYRRYSDDILVAFPSSIKFEEIEKHMAETLDKCSGNYLKINSNKTDRSVYKKGSNGVGVCYSDEGKLSPVQYLGFVFDGTRTHIRPSSISRNRGKIIDLIKKNKKGRTGQATLGSINTREVYKAQSPRKITPIDRYEDKGFAYYARRAGDLQNAPEINKQIRKNDRFIKKKIAEERR